MKQVLRYIPQVLIWSRAAIGCAVIAVVLFHADTHGIAVSVLVLLGVLTDIFDGVVARRLNLSTDELRILDSRVDVFFFVCLVVSIPLKSPSLIWPVVLLFSYLMVLELAVHLISYIRFKKQASTHHYLSKAFSVLLFALIVQLFLLPEVTWYFWLVLGVALLSFIESGAIMLLIGAWQCDVRTVFDIENGIPKQRKLGLRADQFGHQNRTQN